MSFDSLKDKARIKSGMVELSDNLTVEDAFSKIAIQCLENIESNKDGMIEDYDIEGLHQLRVGLRRLKTAVYLFNQYIHVPEALLSEIKWSNSILGKARDWDVMLLTLLPKLENNKDKAIFIEARAILNDRIIPIHQDTSLFVSSNRFNEFICSFRTWINKKGWIELDETHDRQKLEQSAYHVSKHLLKIRLEKFYKEGKKLSGADIRARHQVRKAAKQVNYTLQFFQSYFSSKLTGSYLKNLSKLQDKLGLLNDLAIAQQILRQLYKHESTLDKLNDLIRKQLKSSVDENMDEINKLFKKLMAIKLEVHKHPMIETESF